MGRWTRSAAAVVLAAGAFVATAHAASDARLVARVEHQAVRLAPPPTRVTVIAGGDILTESLVRAAAAQHGAASGVRFDFGPMFGPVRPVLAAADVAICHMELPVGVPGGAYGYHGRSPYGGNLLLAPYEIAPGVRGAGFDRCSTASNHSFDLGSSGIATTIEALNGVGLGWTGTGRSPAESAPSHFTVAGVRVAHVSFTVHSNTVPPADPWRLHLTRNPAVVASHVDRARSEGAEIVLLSVHVSQELLTAPTAADRSFVDSIVRASDVDAVFMHGPHVVQPFEWVAGTPVWWSLGNFVSEMGPPTIGRYSDPRGSDGLLAEVRFTRQPDGSFRAEPRSITICNDRADRTVRPASRELARSELSAAIRDDLHACLARTRAVVPTAQ